MVLPLNTEFGPSPAWTVQGGDGGNQGLTAGSTAGADPQDVFVNGFLAQNLAIEDLALSGTGVVATAGTAYAAKLVVPNIVSTTYGAVLCGAVATTPAHGWFYLLDDNGNLIAKTADQGASYLNATGLVKYAWAGGPLTVDPGVYYGVVAQNGGTGGNLFGVTSPNVLLDVNQTAVAGPTGYRFAKFGTAIGTSGLATPFTMTTMTQDGLVQPFFGLL